MARYELAWACLDRRPINVLTADELDDDDDDADDDDADRTSAAEK